MASIYEILATRGSSTSRRNGGEAGITRFYSSTGGSHEVRLATKLAANEHRRNPARNPAPAKARS